MNNNNPTMPPRFSSMVPPRMQLRGMPHPPPPIFHHPGVGLGAGHFLRPTMAAMRAPVPPPPPPPLPPHLLHHPPPHPHHHHHHQPAGGHHSSYDPYLACNSVHFYNSFHPPGAAGSSSSSHRRRHPAGDQASNQSNPQQQPNIRVIHTSAVIGGGEPGGAQPNPTGNNNPSNNFNPVQNIFNNVAPMIMNQLSGLLGGRPFGPAPTNNTTPRPANQSNTTPQGGPQQQSNQNQILGTVLTEAISLMTAGPNTPGSQQRLNQSMHDFLTALGDTSADEVVLNRHEQPSMVNVFSVFFHSLSLGDLIDLSRSQNRHRVFERTRQPVKHKLKASKNLKLSFFF